MCNKLMQSFSECESSTKSQKKRRPPSIPNDADISISRPVAVKPCPNQGMIPPPPTSAQTSSEKSESMASDTVNTSQNSIATSTIVSQPIILTAATLNITKDNRTDPNTTGHSESATKNEIESNKQPSPSCLRPYRKVEDVTTVKRQPKTGWL